MTQSITALFLLVVLALPIQARAEFYRWIDAEGTVHFTQDASQVPSEQRESARRSTREPAAATGGSVAPVRIRATLGSSEVPFEEEGHLIKVMVRLNGHLNVPFYVDTGSTELVVPARIAEQLGGKSAFTGQVTLNTPSGSIRVPTLQLATVRLGSAEVADLRASVSPSLEVGLLGGAFLNQFRYSVDPVTQTLTLEPRSDASAGRAFGAGRSL